MHLVAARLWLAFLNYSKGVPRAAIDECDRFRGRGDKTNEQANTSRAVFRFEIPSRDFGIATRCFAPEFI